MRMGKTIAVAMSCALVLSAGCFKTFSNRRIYDNCKRYRGVPANVPKTYVATVTWEKDGKQTTTQHVCVLPVTYSIDVYAAPFGKTEASFKMGTDGQLTEASAKLDQEVPEIIRAVGEAAKAIGEAAAKAGGRGEETKFTPPLEPPEGTDHIVKIQFHPLVD